MALNKEINLLNMFIKAERKNKKITTSSLKVEKFIEGRALGRRA